MIYKNFSSPKIKSNYGNDYTKIICTSPVISPVHSAMSYSVYCCLLSSLCLFLAKNSLSSFQNPLISSLDRQNPEASPAT